MNRANAIGGTVFALLALYAVAFASSYDQRLLTLAGIYVILVLGYQFIFGHAGALSLAQGAFFGVGAYTTGVIATAWAPGFLVTFPLSILAAALIAAMVAVPVLRLQTHYFALATLALSQLLLLVAVNWESVTGGANGLAGVPPIEIFGWTATRGLPLLATVWAVAGLAMIVARWQMGPARSAAFTVARETPLAAPAFGMDTQMMRFRAFLLSAAFGGAAGALFVHTNRVVSPEVLGFGVMITCLTMTVVGGRYGVIGALIGGLLLTHLPEWLRELDRYYLVAMGVLLLAMVVFAPNGLATLIRKRTRETPSPRTRAAPNTETFARAGMRLHTRALSKAFGGIRALDNVSLEFRPGEISGIIGPNGAGKTTLANVLTGTIAADSGSVSLSDREISTLTAHGISRAGIARTFQTPQLPPALTVGQIVETARTHAALPQISDIYDALSFCELTPHEHVRAETLPHGLRRKVEICRALVTRPGILILDEPAAGLTPEEHADVGALCAKLAEAGMAILLIDHNVDFLRPIATRLICMDAGRVIADGFARRHVGRSARARGLFRVGTAMSRPLLEISDFSVRYGAVTALSGASFRTYPGEITVLLGPNGAGKTSLLRGVMGLTASSGHITVADTDISALRVEDRVRTGLAWVPEGRRVFPGMTVAENLDVAGPASAPERRIRRTAVTELFPQLGKRLDDRAWQLSGGQQQMLAIGRALMARPRVYLLDEPSLGLAPVIADAVAGALRMLADSETAIVIAEQNAGFAQPLADHVHRLHNGALSDD